MGKYEKENKNRDRERVKTKFIFWLVILWLRYLSVIGIIIIIKGYLTVGDWHYNYRYLKGVVRVDRIREAHKESNRGSEKKK